jgi:RNA polymerase sigma-70 factor, ECF subfamily
MELRVPYPAAVTPDDEVLVSQACAGSQRAFEALYRRHVRYVAGVTYRLLGNDAEVDDVLQEAFLDAAGALSRLRSPADFRPWLVQIAIRRVYRRLAHKRRWRWLQAQVENLTPPASDPQTRHRVQELYHALAQLPPKLRIPWTLHEVEGQTLPEVSRLCDISLATAKRRIADAAERLDRRLRDA